MEKKESMDLAKRILAKQLVGLSADERIEEIEEYFDENIDLLIVSKKTVEEAQTVEGDLLWLIGELRKAFLLKSNEMEMGHGLGDSTVAAIWNKKLRDIYQEKVPKEYICKENKSFFFHNLKRELLKLIVFRFDIKLPGEEEMKDIFYFFSDTYGKSQPELINIIEDLFRKKTNVDDYRLIEAWLKLKSRDKLEHLFAIARTRAGGAKLTFRDMQNTEIVEKLGITDNDKNLLEAFKNACDLIRSQNNLT